LSTGWIRTALIALLVVGCWPHADAAPRRSNDTPERRLAAAEFKRGKQLYAVGDYSGALESFQNGYDNYPLRGFLVNIGQCHRRLGHLKEAATSYQQFLDSSDGPSPLRSEVEEALAEVRSAQREAGQPVTETPRVAEPTTTTTTTPPPPTATAESSGATLTVEKKASPEKKKSRAWVWALVGVGAAVVVGGVTAGVVLGLRSSSTSSGSLGTIDGRTP
jgi:tetratricopeptide (TPR) repeat protein